MSNIEGMNSVNFITAFDLFFQRKRDNLLHLIFNLSRKWKIIG